MTRHSILTGRLWKMSATFFPLESWKELKMKGNRIQSIIAAFETSGSDENEFFKDETRFILETVLTPTNRFNGPKSLTNWSGLGRRAVTSISFLEGGTQ